MSRSPLLPLLLAAALLLGLWALIRGTPQTPPAAVATGTPTPSPPAAPRAAAPTPLAHRLAGTVIGDVQYAIIEHTDGTTELYRPGDEVPGLGRLVAIDARAAHFERDGGRLRLAIVPAATATPTASRAPTGAAAHRTLTPRPPAAPARTARGSAP
jgi:hypothetical protein